MNKRTLLKSALAISVASGFSAPTLAAPGKPIISWMETDFAIIEVSQAATAYKDLITVKPAAEIPVTWDRWSGNASDVWRVKLNGEVVFEDKIKASASQKASTVLNVAKGG